MVDHELDAIMGWLEWGATVAHRDHEVVTTNLYQGALDRADPSWDPGDDDHDDDVIIVTARILPTLDDAGVRVYIDSDDGWMYAGTIARRSTGTSWCSTDLLATVQKVASVIDEK